MKERDQEASKEKEPTKLARKTPRIRCADVCGSKGSAIPFAYRLHISMNIRAELAATKFSLTNVEAANDNWPGEFV